MTPGVSKPLPWQPQVRSLRWSMGSASPQASGEKAQVHDHYLTGSLYCGQCGSLLVMIKAKIRQGVICPYVRCAGRHPKRTNCEQKAVYIPDVKRAVEDYCKQAQARLEDFLALVGDCHAIDMSIYDSLRRIPTQAFFDRLHLTEADAVDGEAGEPFDILFNPEVQSTALRRKQAGGDQSGVQTTNAAGLNKDQLVPPAGFEPATPALGERCSIP